MKAKTAIIIIVAAAIIAAGLWYVFTYRIGYRVVVKTSTTRQPPSYIEVYKNSKLIYHFAPLVPASVGYPRPLKLEKVKRVGSYLVTTWGETGADYFGTHPIVIKLGEKTCKSVPIYSGDLSEDPRIKNYSWTRKDFVLVNVFDPWERVKTILTQGVAVTPERELELTFYADEKPHAEKHDYVRIKVFKLK